MLLLLCFSAELSYSSAKAQCLCICMSAQIRSDSCRWNCHKCILQPSAEALQFLLMMLQCPYLPFILSRKLKHHSSPSLSTLISELLFFKSFFYFSITCATWWDHHVFCPLVITGWSCYLQRRPTVLQRKETPR